VAAFVKDDDYLFIGSWFQMKVISSLSESYSETAGSIVNIHNRIPNQNAVSFNLLR
jgi:hypothetical protein